MNAKWFVIMVALLGVVLSFTARIAIVDHYGESLEGGIDGHWKSGR